MPTLAPATTAAAASAANAAFAVTTNTTIIQNRQQGYGSGVNNQSRRSTAIGMHIMDTAIVEDAETTTTSSPESLYFTPSLSSISALLTSMSSSNGVSMVTAMSGNSATAEPLFATHTSVPAVPKGLAQSTSSSTIAASPSTPVKVPVFISALVPVPAATATPKPTSNKFTRKRERVCNNNSSNTIAKMVYCKAFAK